MEEKFLEEIRSLRNMYSTYTKDELIEVLISHIYVENKVNTYKIEVEQKLKEALTRCRYLLLNDEKLTVWKRISLWWKNRFGKTAKDYVRVGIVPPQLPDAESISFLDKLKWLFKRNKVETDKEYLHRLYDKRVEDEIREKVLK